MYNDRRQWLSAAKMKRDFLEAHHVTLHALN
jgi:hypothetical protein